MASDDDNGGPPGTPPEKPGAPEIPRDLTPPGRTHKHDWAAMRDEWNAAVGRGERLTVADFAADRGVARESVSRQMTKDLRAGSPWAPVPQRKLKPKAPRPPAGAGNNVVAFPNRRQRAQNAPRTQPVADTDDAEDTVPLDVEGAGNDVTVHASIAALLMVGAQKTLRRYMRGRIERGPTQSEADVFKSAVAGAREAVQLSREIAGLTAGERSAKVANEEGRVEEAVLVVRPRPELATEAESA